MYTALYSKMANAHWPLAYILHAWGQGLPGAIQLYNAIQYTAIHRYTLYTLYNTPLACGEQASSQPAPDTEPLPADLPAHVVRPLTVTVRGEVGTGRGVTPPRQK